MDNSILYVIIFSLIGTLSAFVVWLYNRDFKSLISSIKDNKNHQEKVEGRYTEQFSQLGQLMDQLTNSNGITQGYMKEVQKANDVTMETSKMIMEEMFESRGISLNIQRENLQINREIKELFMLRIKDKEVIDDNKSRIDKLER